MKRASAPSQKDTQRATINDHTKIFHSVQRDVLRSIHAVLLLTVCGLPIGRKAMSDFGQSAIPLSSVMSMNP